MSEYSCGILTIHQTVNYGATLQAFSTDRFLNQHGVSAVVVDYRQPTHEETSTPCKALAASWRKDNDRSLVHRLKLAAALLLQTDAAVEMIGYVLHKYGAYGIRHKLDVYRSALKRKLKIK